MTNRLMGVNFLSALLHQSRVMLKGRSGMSAMNTVSILSPMLLPLMVGVLAPWSLNRIGHV